MQTSLVLDEDLRIQVASACEQIKETPATVMRMALRAGLPLVVGRHQVPRPEGYFDDAYPQPKERRALEEAMAEQTQGPDR